MFLKNVSVVFHRDVASEPVGFICFLGDGWKLSGLEDSFNWAMLDRQFNAFVYRHKSERAKNVCKELLAGCI